MNTGHLRYGGQCRNLLHWLDLRQRRPQNCVSGVSYNIRMNMAQLSVQNGSFITAKKIVNATTRYVVGLLKYDSSMSDYTKYDREEELVAFCRAFLSLRMDQKCRQMPIAIFIRQVTPGVLIQFLTTFIEYLTGLSYVTPRTAGVCECQLVMLESLGLISQWWSLHDGECEKNWLRRKSLYTYLILKHCFGLEEKIRVAAAELFEDFMLPPFYFNRALCFLIKHPSQGPDPLQENVLRYACKLRFFKIDRDYRHCGVRSKFFVERLLDAIFNVAVLSIEWQVPLERSFDKKLPCVSHRYYYGTSEDALIPASLLVDELENVRNVWVWAVDCACEDCYSLVKHLAESNLWRTLQILLHRLNILSASEDRMCSYIEPICDILDMFCHAGRHWDFWYGVYSIEELRILNDLCGEHPSCQIKRSQQYILKAIECHENVKPPDPQSIHFLLETDKLLSLSYSDIDFSSGVLSQMVALSSKVKSSDSRFLPIKKVTDALLFQEVSRRIIDRKFAESQCWLAMDLSRMAIGCESLNCRFLRVHNEDSQSEDEKTYDQMSESSSSSSSESDERASSSDSRSTLSASIQTFTSLSYESAIWDEYLPHNFLF